MNWTLVRNDLVFRACMLGIVTALIAGSLAVCFYTGNSPLDGQFHLTEISYFSPLGLGLYSALIVLSTTRASGQNPWRRRFSMFELLLPVLPKQIFKTKVLCFFSFFLLLPFAAFLPLWISGSNAAANSDMLLKGLGISLGLFPLISFHYTLFPNRPLAHVIFSICCLFPLGIVSIFASAKAVESNPSLFFVLVLTIGFSVALYGYWFIPRTIPYFDQEIKKQSVGDVGLTHEESRWTGGLNFWLMRSSIFSLRVGPVFLYFSLAPLIWSFLLPSQDFFDSLGSLYLLLLFFLFFSPFNILQKLHQIAHLPIRRHRLFCMIFLSMTGPILFWVLVVGFRQPSSQLFESRLRWTVNSKVERQWELARNSFRTNI